MTTKPMSSRLQGLKFMQRGAQRAALQAEKEAPEHKKAIQPEEPAESTDPDQWVVPFSRRVVSPNVEENWGEWLLDATNEQPLNTRRTFGHWKTTGHRSKKEKQSDDDFKEAHALLNESDDEQENDSESEGEDSASDSEDEFLSANSSPNLTFQKPPSAASRRKSNTPSAPAPKRLKHAAVVDKSRSLRKKKQR